MHEYTKAKVSKALEEANRALTLEDVEDIVALDVIAGEISGAGKAAEELEDFFQLGGRVYSMPTPMRLEAMAKVSKAYALNPYVMWAVLWCLDAERTKTELACAPGLGVVMRYSRGIDATGRAVRARLSEVLAKAGRESESEDGELDSQDKSQKGAWYACCVMAREIGGSPEFWYDATPKIWADGIEAVSDKVQAEIDSVNRSNKKGRVAPIPTPRIKAVHEFSKRLKKMQDRWAEEAKNGED